MALSVFDGCFMEKGNYWTEQGRSSNRARTHPRTPLLALSLLLLAAATALRGLQTARPAAPLLTRLVLLVRCV